MTFLTCNPIVSVPIDRSGGDSASFNVEGDLSISNFDTGGVPIVTHTVRSLGMCNCFDAPYQRVGKFGIDAQCYCGRGQIQYAPLGRCVYYRDRFHLPQPRNACPRYGNPIQPLSGVKSQDEEVPLGGRLGSLNLTYDTSLNIATLDGTVGFVPTAPVSLGGSWSTSLHRGLMLQRSEGGQIVGVQAGRGSNRWVSFWPGADGRYYSFSSVSDRLVAVDAGWRYFDATASTIESYDTSGRLTQITGANGQWLGFVYSTSDTPGSVAPVPGLLIAVTDRHGAAAQFSYELPPEPGARPRLVRVIDRAGGATSIGYTGNNPTSIVWPDAQVRRFLYENGDLPWAMTGVIDELGVRRSRYGYDSGGRATSTESAAGIDRYVARWRTPPAWSVVTTYDEVTNTLWRDHYLTLPEGVSVQGPNGAIVEHEAVLVDGTPYLSRTNQPAGSGCAASSSAFSYDGRGNVLSSDQFTGGRSCFAYDPARNLQTVRIDGLTTAASCPSPFAVGSPLPAGSRRVSTEWHPDWPLRTATAEPGRMSTYVYNGMRDPFTGVTASCAPTGAILPDGKPIAVLCKEVLQATTDTTGASGFSALVAAVPPRVRSYTYDSAGQMLSQTDPTGAVTTYSYHPVTTADVTAGDLAAVVNPAGHLTSYPRYHRNGRPLLEIAPNGRSSEYAYDARGRLTRSTTAGAETTYTYTSSGQLATITQPDGSWLRFEYDAAQRLVATSNQLGDRIDYQLDATGNRIGETVRDEGGVLRRALARSFDALNRVSQVSGREP